MSGQPRVARRLAGLLFPNLGPGGADSRQSLLLNASAARNTVPSSQGRLISIIPTRSPADMPAGTSSAEKAPGGDQVLFAGQNLPPSYSQVDRSLSILRVQDVGFHSGQSLLQGFKIEAGARELGCLRILLL
jgi:hypothetical protein